MTDKLRPVVVKIIENFQSGLDAGVRDRISNSQYTDLGLMIDEAISEEMAAAAERLEAVARELRANSRKTDIEL